MEGPSDELKLDIGTKIGHTLMNMYRSTLKPHLEILVHLAQLITMLVYKYLNQQMQAA